MRINGTKVVDAKSKVTIHITADDVKKGANKDPGSCAAARACLRETAATEARVHVGRTYLKIDDKWVRFQTPEALRSEIVAFDRGGSFEPGEYQLRPMAPSDRANGRRQGGETASSSQVAQKRNTSRLPHNDRHPATWGQQVGGNHDRGTQH